MYRLLLANSRNTRQSPIDILVGNCVFDEATCQASSFKLEYEAGDCEYMEAQGNVCKAYTGQESKSILTCSHLPAKYQLIQFHFHWGEDSSLGSEHLLNGHAYAGECHFVFWNTSYGNIDEAATRPDGLAVVAVLLKEGEYNDAYSSITSLIRKALENSGIAKLPKHLDVNLLLPHDKEYFFYEGSLTTPPYTENVLWTVFMHPVQLSAKQLSNFRMICSANYRECQCLGNRKIICSREPKFEKF